MRKRDKKVALDFVGGYSKGDMKCLEYQNESVRWIPQYILMGMKRKRKLNIEILYRISKYSKCDSHVLLTCVRGMAMDGITYLNKS